jgi:hypothetical protein
LQRLAERPLSDADKYRAVLSRANDLYGAEMAIVDSSKQLSGIISLKGLPELNLLVLHNLRDVRAFTISMIDNAIRKNSRASLPEMLFLEWYRSNRSVCYEVSRAQGRTPLRITYEALCFATEMAADRIAAYLGDRYIDPAADLKSGPSHIISGNRFRLCDAEKTNISYDCRWFSRSEWLRPYVLMPMVRKYNEECLREWGTFSKSRA